MDVISKPRNTRKRTSCDTEGGYRKVAFGLSSRNSSTRLTWRRESKTASGAARNLRQPLSVPPKAFPCIPWFMKSRGQALQAILMASHICFRCWEFWNLGGLEDFYDHFRNSSSPNLPTAKAINKSYHHVHSCAARAAGQLGKRTSRPLHGPHMDCPWNGRDVRSPSQGSARTMASLA